MNSISESQKNLVVARRRAGARLGFSIHLFVFVAVNVVLVCINIALTPGYKWFVWPLLGWGIGLLSHAAGVFYFPKMLKRMTDQELQKLKSGSE